MGLSIEEYLPNSTKYTHLKENLLIQVTNWIILEKTAAL